MADYKDYYDSSVTRPERRDEISYNHYRVTIAASREVKVFSSISEVAVRDRAIENLKDLGYDNPTVTVENTAPPIGATIENMLRSGAMKPRALTEAVSNVTGKPKSEVHDILWHWLDAGKLQLTGSAALELTHQ